MARHAEQGVWHTYDILPLKFEVDGFASMPLDDLLDSYLGAEHMSDPLPVRVTKTMVAKRECARIAPIEASLLHCCSVGAVCLNSAIYGGLDTLEPIAIAPQAEEVKRKVASFCGPFRPLEGPLDRKVFVHILHLVRTAATELPADKVSNQLLQSIAVYAAVEGTPSSQHHGKEHRRFPQFLGRTSIHAAAG